MDANMLYIGGRNRELRTNCFGKEMVASVVYLIDRVKMRRDDGTWG